eukprot:6524801-Alexandrium_andersonii.AAC.1
MAETGYADISFKITRALLKDMGPDTMRKFVAQSGKLYYSTLGPFDAVYVPAFVFVEPGPRPLFQSNVNDDRSP